MTARVRVGGASDGAVTVLSPGYRKRHWERGPGDSETPTQGGWLPVARGVGVALSLRLALTLAGCQ